MRSTDGAGIGSGDGPDGGEHVRIGEIGLAVRLDPAELLVEHSDLSAVGCARWLIAVVDILEMYRQRQPNPGRGVREAGVQRPAMVETDLSLAQAEGDPGDGASIRGELLLNGVEVGVVEEPGILGVGPAVAAVENGEGSAPFVDVVERDPRRQQPLAAARAPVGVVGVPTDGGPQ